MAHRNAHEIMTVETYNDGSLIDGCWTIQCVSLNGSVFPISRSQISLNQNDRQYRDISDWEMGKDFVVKRLNFFAWH